VNRKLIVTAWLLSVAIAGSTAASEPAPASRFDVEVVDAPARAFFLGLAKRGGDNVLVHQQVSGSLTLSLHGVTVAETLDAVRELYGFDYRKLAAGYFVLPASLQTRFFQVNYLDMSRQGASRTMVSSGSITDSRHSGTGGGNGGGSSATGVSGATGSPGNSGAGGSGAELTGSSIVSRTDVDFWSQLEASVKAVIGTGAERSVVINRQSGMVAVRASPDELRGVETYLQRIQQTVARQVILEAKIIEVELNDAFQAGINWGAVLRNGSQTFFAGLTTPVNGFDNPLLSNTGAPVTVGPGNPVTSLPSAGLGGAFTLAADLHDVGAFLDLLKTQGTARVLSSPRVSTLQNQKAVIKAGTDEFFVTGVSSNTTTGTATTTSRDVELTPFFSGIALDVTPQIDGEDHVILHIHPSVSEVRDQSKRITVGGQTDVLPLAVSEIRESDSVVKARSGQMVIIGGLMRSTRKQQNYGTPGLSAVPWLGNLFKSRRNAESKTELVILLRPIIVDDSNAAGLTAEAVSSVEAAAPGAAASR
jgi:MSHA biogenesis protein MshL